MTRGLGPRSVPTRPSRRGTSTALVGSVATAKAAPVRGHRIDQSKVTSNTAIFEANLAILRLLQAVPQNFRFEECA